MKTFRNVQCSAGGRHPKGHLQDTMTGRKAEGKAGISCWGGKDIQFIKAFLQVVMPELGKPEEAREEPRQDTAMYVQERDRFIHQQLRVPEE